MTPGELTFSQRFALTLIIVLAIILALALFGYLSGRWDEAEAQTLPPSKYDARLIELEREAIEVAYKQQVEHLFQTWMKDDTGQPQRAVTGVRNARRAFIRAMTEIDKRAGQ